VYKRALYAQLAEYYDRIYWWKNYYREVDFLLKVFRRYGVHGKRILEVACGTGNHTKILTSKGYEVTGVDISNDVLRIARRKVRDHATFVQGDMRELDRVIGGEFDAVVCLFSAISYNVTMGELRKVLGGFYRHLKAGGVAVFDTHFMKRNFVDGFRDEDVFDDGRVIGARLAVSTRKGDVGEISFTYLIKDGRKVILLRNDVHRLGLFDPEDFVQVLEEAGFRKTAVFADWTFRMAREQKEFRDSVYVGSRLDGS
jgi:ubiquinone/menaquinone biosynthesis C-methylase UbiE